MSNRQLYDFKGRVFPSCQVSLHNPAERRITLDESKALLKIEGNAHKEDIPPFSIVIEQSLGVDAKAEDD